MEVEVPDVEVLLSDFDAWSLILCDALISDSEEESKAIEESYLLLSPEEHVAFMHRNWERVFDLTPINSDWTIRGDSIQATFWELKREQVMEVRMFTSSC